MIVTVGNTKGGVGKSMVALNLAIARILRGHDVWLVEGDRQTSLLDVLEDRDEKHPRVAVAHYHEGPTLRQQVLLQQSKFDDVVIDVGGRDSTALRAALTISDLVVIPIRPRTVEINALKDMVALLDEVWAAGAKVRAVGVLSLADAQGTDNEGAAEEIARRYPNFPMVIREGKPFGIGDRKSMPNAFGAGLSVLEHKPKDAKAIEEVNTLYDIVFNMQWTPFEYSKTIESAA